MECSEIDCVKIVHSRGLCQPHYRQVTRREKDPLVGTRNPGPVPAEGAVSHRKLTDQEKFDKRMAKKDAKTHCVLGHELTPENCYSTGTRQKVCRLCQRGAQQKYRGYAVDMTTPIRSKSVVQTHCVNGHDYATYAGTNNSHTLYCKKCRMNNHRKSVYDLTEEEFETMLLTQNNVCPICLLEFKNTRDTHVDHDHLTGYVRAILCSPCNTGLGQFKDDTMRLRRAFAYLNHHFDRITDLDLGLTEEDEE